MVKVQAFPLCLISHVYKEQLVRRGIIINLGEKFQQPPVVEKSSVANFSKHSSEQKWSLVMGVKLTVPGEHTYL